MSFMSSIKYFTRTVNENKANIVEAATHVAVGAYLVHQNIKNPSQETMNLSFAWMTGAVVGGIHGVITDPGNTLHIDPNGTSFLEEGSRIDGGGLGLLRGATTGVLAYKAVGLTAKYYQQTAEIIGDVAGDAVDMIA